MSMKKFISYIETCKKEELIFLNEKIICRLKTLREMDLLQATQKFRLWDVVSFVAENAKRIGVIIAINKKSIKVHTTENITWTVNPSLLQIEKNPPKKVQDFIKTLFPMADTPKA